MTIERKVGMGIAGQPSGGAADVAEVFSTHLYAGNAGSQTITNGIDLAGEGGMVWFKRRNGAVNHVIFDTERWTASSGNGLFPNLTNAAGNINELTGFNSNGFGVTASGYINDSYDMASWTFRNSKKFFKAVTFSYGGSSASPTVVTHNLGCTVGMTFVKQTNGTQNWNVQHKDVTGTDNNGALNLTMLFSGGSGQSTSFTSITDTQATFGAAASFPAGTYVAYFFADNSSENADDQMIKCGSYTGTGASVGASVTLGWEPQFVLVKAASAGGSWAIMDTMRGIPNDSDNPTLFADTDAAEVAQANWLEINSTGFKTLNGNYANGNASGVTYIYMAIRAPMMKEPEAATDVFAIDTRGSSAATADGVVWHSGFPVDLAIQRNVTGVSSPAAYDRFRGSYSLFTDTTAAEQNQGGHKFDSMNGFDVRTLSAATNQPAWMWKRAKGFFDCLTWTGNDTAGRTIPHNLGSVPAMMLVKMTNGAYSWNVYHSGLGATKFLELNTTNGGQTSSAVWNNTAPTDSVFTVGNEYGVNQSGKTYVAYLFATLAGISKCGSYVGNGSSQTISCGFSAGARYILIKRTDATGDWYVWDSARGIVAGNDPHLSLNSNTAQVTNDDSVDPHNSGFIVNQVSATNINVSSGTYIFYAIA